MVVEGAVRVHWLPRGVFALSSTELSLLCSGPPANRSAGLGVGAEGTMGPGPPGCPPLGVGLCGLGDLGRFASPARW